MSKSHTGGARGFTPVVRTVTAPWEPAEAFRRFTEGMASWWPLESHSVGGQAAETVVFDGREGGRIVERIAGGREAVWGTVEAWDPPRRTAFTWHPGHDPATAQQVEVAFTQAAGGTFVRLTHTGFEKLGPLARKARMGYPIGWAWMLGLYAGRRGPFMAIISGLTAVMMALNRRRASREGSSSG